MKVRQDFVTNSSSSSFLLARKGEFSEKQKEAIIRFVEENLLGSPVPAEEEEFQDFLRENYLEEHEDGYYVDEIYDVPKQMRKIIRRGETPLYGDVSFDCADDTLATLYYSLWSAIEEADPERFRMIKADLSY